MSSQADARVRTSSADMEMLNHDYVPETRDPLFLAIASPDAEDLPASLQRMCLTPERHRKPRGTVTTPSGSIPTQAAGSSRKDHFLGDAY